MKIRVVTNHTYNIIFIDWFGFFIKSTAFLGSIITHIPPHVNEIILTSKNIDDYITYANELAFSDELIQQTSYFQNDIKKMKGM